MSAALSRCRSLPVPAVGLGWAAVLLALVGLGVATAPWTLRAAVAAIAAVAAATWGWRHGAGAGRNWIAAAPLAAWIVGTFGWGGATAVAFAAWVALLRIDTRGGPLRWPRSPQPTALPKSVPPPVRPEPEPIDDDPSDDEWADGQLGDDEFDDEADEPEPDQWFARTADASEGELVVRCEDGVGVAHVLFWPAFEAAPRVWCHPADGLGRVRAARVLPQGVRFEIIRPDRESGPVRICYEATTAER